MSEAISNTNFFYSAFFKEVLHYLFFPIHYEVLPNNQILKQKKEYVYHICIYQN